MIKRLISTIEIKFSIYDGKTSLVQKSVLISICYRVRTCKRKFEKNLTGFYNKCCIYYFSLIYSCIVNKCIMSNRTYFSYTATVFAYWDLRLVPIVQFVNYFRRIFLLLKEVTEINFYFISIVIEDANTIFMPNSILNF